MLDKDKFPIVAIIIVVVLILFWMLNKSSKSEKYNAGANIDFRRTKTDRNLPASVMPVSDVQDLGSPFIIINN